MSDAIGVRGWCKKCRHGKIKWKSVYCQNKNSGFYGQKVNSILCAPCFVPDKSKDNVKVEAVGFRD